MTSSFAQRESGNRAARASEPPPAGGGARGESTTKFTTVFTIRFHAQAQQKQKSTTKFTRVFTQVFTTVFTQVFTTLWWTESTPRLSNIHPSIHHRIHSSIHLDIHPAGTIIVTVAGLRVKLVRQNKSPQKKSPTKLVCNRALTDERPSGIARSVAGGYQSPAVENRGRAGLGPPSHAAGRQTQRASREIPGEPIGSPPPGGEGRKKCALPPA